MSQLHRQVKEGRKKWQDGIDAQDEQIDKEEINGFTEYKLLEYEAYKLQDDDLWEQFHDDFKTFSVESFKECNSTILRNLRHFLRVRGVWVKKDRRTTIPLSLFNTL
jgi:hypothetical protein